jgi:hypothetical protein
MKPFTHGQRQAGAAEQPLEQSRQVPVSHESQISLLAKTNTYSLSNLGFALWC